MRQTRLVPIKHGMSALMLALKEEEIKADAPGAYRNTTSER